jgi:sarcosine oxidase subunit alpha
MTTRPSKRTPIHAWHAGHGARFQERDGWQVAANFGNPAAAAAAAKGVGLMDVSYLTKVELLGNVAALARLLAGSPALDRPRCVARLTDPEPALACRLADDRLLVLAESPAADWNHSLKLLAPDHKVESWDATSAYAAFHLEGPHVEDLLRRLTAVDVRFNALPPGSCAETGLAGVAALLVRPPDRPGTRLLVGWDVAEYVWERLLDAGTELGLAVLGMTDRVM